MHIDEQRALMAHMLADRLSEELGTWTAHGTSVAGPGTTGIGVVEHEGQPAGHVDLGFLINRTRDDAPVIWDCAAGVGPSVADRLAMALDTWVRGTWPVIREFLSGRGEYAEHLAGDRAVSSSRVIHGPICGFGHVGSARALQTWWLETQPLQQLGRALTAGFDRPALNGVKVLVGGDGVAEVRINGTVHPPATAALKALPWPRLEKFGYLRVFALAIAPEPTQRAD